MGLFSFFTKSKPELYDITNDYTQYFTKDLFFELVDKHSSIMLYFTLNEGWIGANKTFFKMFKYKNIEEFRSEHESARDLFSSESEEIFTEDDRSWLEYIKKYNQDGYHVTILSPEKNTLTMNAKCHAFANMKDFYILELEDVTELYQAKMKTKEIEELKTRFLTNIGHEFRTPMNGILGFIELINETSLNKKQSDYIEMINRSSRNLMANIETLLDLSKMQGGKLTLEKAPFEILSEMEKLTYNFCLQGRDKGIKILSFIDPKLPKEIDGDLRKIKQVMNSLIQNALKFTPRGGRVIVEVKLLKRQTNGECSIGFSVKDNGKGIAYEQIAMITEPFSSHSNSDERVGVGLSLSHGLVNLMGSDLRIHSEEGHGSHFNFVLNFKTLNPQTFKMMPKKKVKVLLLDKTKIDEANFLTTYLRSFAIDVIKANILDENVYDDVDALYIVADQYDSSWILKLGTYPKKKPIIILLEEEEKLQAKLTHIVSEVVRRPILPSFIHKHLNSLYKSFDNKPEKRNKGLQLRDKVIALIVEDNIINQKLVQILLQEYRIFVSTASNGVEAVDMASKNKYDIIFMDIDMPEKDGITATKEIKERLSLNEKTPVVALTAMALAGDKERLLHEGLDDYISKPLSRAKLEKILNKYLKVRVY
jgi:CheY-like chemotaxis protein/nitrogen-specific signal transduction histidine kinase